jgi:ribose 5-phosphate isomerase B
MAKPIIPIGADHRGYKLKARIMEWLAAHGYEATDLGTHSEERCDAFDFAKKLAEEFKSNGVQSGVLICGTGQAMAMTANRHKNIRAALCANAEIAKLTREHNDTNVLVLGADFISPEEAVKCLKAFLNTKFLGGRYAERRDKLTALGGL